MRTDLLNEQLGIIASHIPTIHFLSLASADGLRLAEWSPRHPEITKTDLYQYEVAELYAALASALSASTRGVIRNLDGGDHKLTILQAEQGAAFQVIIGDNYRLLLGVRHYRSVDEVLWILQQHWGELLRLLDVTEPPKL